jgi:hypothetical protein
MSIENLNNYKNNVVEFLNEVEAVLGTSPAQGAAIASLTDSTTGTADETLADVGATFSQATLNNNFADLNAKIDLILAALRTHGLIAT